MKKENKNYIYKKEKKIFWTGLALGIGGGILGSTFSSLFIELLMIEIKKYLWGNFLLWGLFILVGGFLLWLLNNINKKLKRLYKK